MRPRLTEPQRARIRSAAGTASSVFAALVMIAAAAALAFKTAAQISVGPAWDSFAFLCNAAFFAGQGFGYTELARPPMISLVTSVLMRLGLKGAWTVQVVEAAFIAAGVAALYVLMRRRFARPVAALGALAFLVAPPVWRWVGVGYTDIVAVSLCMVALLVAIAATERDPRWYLALPTLLLASTLMRTTSLLFVGVVAVWIGLRSRPLRHWWQILAGLAVAAVAYLPLAAFYARQVGNPLYPIVASSSIQQAATASKLGGLEQPVTSFVRALPSFTVPAPMSIVALAALALAALGLVVPVAQRVFVDQVRPKRLAGAVVVVALSVVAVIGRGPSSALIVAVAVFAIWRFVATIEVPAEGGPVRTLSAASALDATMVAWLVGLIVFHEQWAQKVERYYIAMAPALIYLVALGLSCFVAHVRQHRGSLASALTLRGALVPVTLAVLVAASLGVDVARTSWAPDPAIADAQRVASWLRSGRLADGSRVYSDYWPQTAWYLKAPVTAMPTFGDESAVGHELAKNSADFYVTMRGAYSVPGYTAGEDTGMTRILVADRVACARPRVQYLGVGWENYVERLTGYSLFLEHAEGDYNMEGSAYADEYDVGRLRRFDAVAVYGAAWHDRAKAERTLIEYVEGGGTLVLDASANLAQPHSLQDCVLFDTVFSRRAVPASARVRATGRELARHPELADLRSAPFSTAEDPVWYGAFYAALPGSEPLDVLATVDGMPIVAQRHWGRGRVIFVGGNLLWHAQATGNADEARLVRAIFDDALTESRSASNADVRESAGM